jgi:hypothetical protein
MHSFVWFWTIGIHDPAWVQAGAAIALVLLTLVTLAILVRYAWDTRTLARTSVEQARYITEQTEILRQSVAVAQISARAAKTSADIAAGVSIPTLKVHEFGVGDVGAASAEAFFQFPKIKITIKNHGQTPAFLNWWSLCFTCEDLPDIPVYQELGRGVFLKRAVVQPGELYTLPDLAFFQRQEFLLEDVKAILKGEKTFIAYGYICYGDVFNHPLRRLKFCETVLNIFDGQQMICDWWEELAPPAYVGNDQFPTKEQGQEKPDSPN